MKLATIFKAYRNAEWWRTHFLEMRGYRRGIMVDHDKYAKKYQRMHRQVEYFADKLANKIEELEKEET